MTDYEAYVERYANTRGITVAEAETHYLVKLVKKYYEES